jgi:CubicO group peptidase (beta-lactamase class C family)
MKYLVQLLVLFLLLGMIAACSDTTGTKPAAAGTLKITTKTTGNGGKSYNIYLKTDNFSKSIGINNTIFLTPLNEGSHRVKLLNIPTNCSLKGTNPRSIHITAGDTTSTSFVVACKGSKKVAGVKQSIEQSIANHAFPGAAVAIGHDSTVYVNAYGHYTYSSNSRPMKIDTRFDLASLTKVVATTTAVMLLYDQGRISLNQTVTHYIPGFAQNGKGQVTVRELLSHSSGLKPDISLNGLHIRQGVINRILALPLSYKTGSKSVYSDLNFIVLMLVVNAVTNQNFAAYCEQHIFKPLGMQNTGFMTGNYSDGLFAPTATTLQGRVNDPTARMMGGVSGNAGLYSTAQDLAKFGEMYINDGKVNGKTFLKESTIKLFTHNAGVPGSNRALGWEMNGRIINGFCSCGRHFSLQSFGHRGYTGTAIWIDPQHSLFGFLLDNGTYPSGGDDVSTIFPARQSFYNQIYSSLILR